MTKITIVLKWYIFNRHRLILIKIEQQSAAKYNFINQQMFVINLFQTTLPVQVAMITHITNRLCEMCRITSYNKLV